ncbi:MAG: rhodanese-like domain-containing protein [Chlorobi bacterium]|nr:rhodanese-like domain-containing protein [Chlorobiota bacterium]
MDNQNFSLESKKISKKLPVIGIVFIAIVIFGLISMEKPKHVYRLSTEEMLNKTLKHDYIIKYDKFFDIYYNHDSLYRFIDLRSAHDYQVSHLPGAINIPLSKILNKEYAKIVNQDKKINVLYYSDQCGACGPWMILTQLGYKNNYILGGGYDYVTQNIINKYSPMLGDYSAEKPKYDFKAVINSTGGNSSVSSSSDSNTPAPVIKKKAKKEEEGGC